MQDIILPLLERISINYVKNTSTNVEAKQTANKKNESESPPETPKEISKMKTSASVFSDSNEKQ